MDEQLEKARKLNLQAWSLCKKDSPRAIRLARRAQKLLAGCEEARPADEFQSLKTITYCLDMLSKPQEALITGLKANSLAGEIGDKHESCAIQSLLGRIYWHIDDYATSIDYYLTALKLAQAEGFPDLEISLINGLGLVQYGLENYPAALEYFKTCLEKAGADDLTGRADASNNIAYVLHVLGRDSEALEYGTAGLALFNQLGTVVGKMETLHSLGAIHLALKNYDQAAAYLQEGLEIARQNNSVLLEISYMIEISLVQRAQGRLDEAEKGLLQALQASEKISSPTNISLARQHLVEVYKEKHNYRAALEQFEAFHTVYKKVFNEQSDRRLKNLEILHQVEITRKQADLYRELAGTDFLTGLVNMRRFWEIAGPAFQSARDAMGQFAIIMLDVDHFKEVNDRYGHQAGDQVLAGIAARIKKSLRQVDVAGRYGGEEFIILVKDAPPEICIKIAERIRLAIFQQPFTAGGAVIPVTASLGLACLDPGQANALDSLINAADQAMYQAKQSGRNCVVTTGLRRE